MLTVRTAELDSDFAGCKSNNRTLAAVILLFTATMFAASGLLFLVQPMFARMVLPRYGGSASVWNTCMLFFQTMLLLGYLYSHVTTRWLGVRRQALWHCLVLLLPLLFLPLTARTAEPGSADSPVTSLLWTMAVSVGVPFFVLATSAPLFQRWFATIPVPSARDPYFLYAASNLGSMVALLGYPFLIEPLFGVRQQTHLWTGGYLALILLTAVCAWAVRRNGTSEVEQLEPIAARVSPMASSMRLRWVALSFAPSSLMLGVTTHISTDLAAVPLLWVVPLALYLLTFVIAFSQRGAALGGLAALAAPPAIIASLITIVLSATAWWFMPLHVAAFFLAALVCHRALAGLRPGVARLTEFYLWISFGGMLGGVFNGLVAPQIFSTVFEYPLILLLIGLFVPFGAGERPASHAWLAAGYAAAAAGVACWILAQPAQQAARGVMAVTFGVAVALGAARAFPPLRLLALFLTGLIAFAPPISGGSALFTARSFFGVMRVFESPDGTYRTLRHGSTTHGRQQIPDGGTCQPTSYFHPDGPVGDVVRAFGSRMREVAVVGLGTGAMACYAAPGQRWTFFEIDPLVERIARDPALFTYLQNASPDVEVSIGDGRLRLQEMPPGVYDLIVIDAFSSDAIPVHLLTREALQLYVSRLKPDGLVAFHISNRYLRLEPVVAALVAQEGLFASSRFDTAATASAERDGRLPAHWIVVSPSPVPPAALIEEAQWRLPETSDRAAAWTDDYSNIFRAFW